MSAQKRINKNHEDYPEYIEKCRRLSETFIAKENAEERKHPDWRGLDHPAAREIHEIKKQFHAELSSLQKEYSHLFSGDIVDGE